MEFSGKTVLITGGSRGVGFALARIFCEGGAQVAITARGEKRLFESRDKLEAAGHQVLAVAGDVAGYEESERMVKETVDRFGRLDIVVNNAGVSMRGDFKDLAPAVCRRVVDTNLMGCINISRAAAPHIIESRGSITFISSIAGLFGLPGASIYCATKKALIGLTESLRLELLPLGVHVGIVYLGFTEHDPEKRLLGADGSLLLPDRPGHHTQDRAGRLIVEMIAKRKRKIVMTPAGVLGAMVYRVSPVFLEKAVLFARSSKLGIAKKFS